MGYMHINNLYADQRILNFKRVYCLEKVHGTNSYVSWNGDNIRFFSRGEKHENFVKLFNEEELKAKFIENGHFPIVIFGEAYGGKCQGMKDVYGDELKFVAFDVKSGDMWLDVPKAENVARKLGIDFVHYDEVNCTLENLDACMNAHSIQAIKNGMGEGKWREGIVIRPINEMRDNSGERVMAKHRRPDSRETKKERRIVDPLKLEVLTKAKEIADEWVTKMRLIHVIDRMPHGIGIENTRDVIFAMIEDIKREGSGETQWSKDAEKEIGKCSAILFKRYLQEKLSNIE